MLFIQYPRCGTCRKAKAWLDAQGVSYEERHITEEPPTAEELLSWSKDSGLPLTRFLNTSGMKYRELGLAQKRKEMSDTELAELLATDGMLVKRPILIVDAHHITTGFKEDVWADLLNK